MSDADTLTLQLLVPLITATAVYLFLKATNRDLFVGGCASTIIAFLVIAVIAVARVGITSTLPIGLAITAGYAFVISGLFFAIARWFEKRRSN